MATASLGVRERMAAASKRIARVKLADRVATGVITLGGLFIIVCVLFIFVFIFEQALPLFRGAQGRKVATLALVPPQGAVAAPKEPLAIGVDEYQKYLYEVAPDARIVLYGLADGTPQREFRIAELEGATVTAAVSSLTGDLALGTADGRAALVQVFFRPVFDGAVLKDLESDVRVKRVVTVDPGKRAVRSVASQISAEGEILLAAVVGDDEIVLARAADAAEGQAPPEPALATLRTHGGEKVSQVRVGRPRSWLAPSPGSSTTGSSPGRSRGSPTLRK